MSALAAWREIRHHPVYQRERGRWGRPNPFYERLLAYSPLLIFGAILLGFCSAVSNPFLYAGSNELLALYCLICLPSALLTIITVYGSIMAPALTAPSILAERAGGSWDILRTVPLPTGRLLLAKLAGALARLRIWLPLLALSALQGVAVFFTLTLSSGSVVWSLPAALAAVARPWLEILFAAVAGLAVSLQARSGAVALAATYGAVVLMRLVNSTFVWSFAVSALGGGSGAATLLGVLGPTVVYAAAVASLLAWAARSAGR